MNITVLVNPQAGNGHTSKLWPQIKPLLSQSIGEFQTVHTTCRGDATSLTRKALDSAAERIIAIGGDGHLNEVLNGFIENDTSVSPDTALSFLMTGTGCDFQRSFGYSGNWRENIFRLKAASTRQIDVGKVSYTAPDKTRQIRYFSNIASFGLSGAVDRCVEQAKWGNFLAGNSGGGTLLFLWATLKTVFSHPSQSVRFRIDDGPEEEIRTRLGLLANGRFFGGGMPAAPEAALDDGKLDLLLLNEISIPKLLWCFPQIYRGTHLQIPEVFYQKIRKFTAFSSEQVPLDIDGESPGYLEATFEILPKILKLQI